MYTVQILIAVAATVNEGVDVRRCVFRNAVER